MPLQVLNHPDERHLVRRVSVCPAPMDVGQNASYVLTWTAGNLTTIQKTINGVAYSRTMTYSVDDELETVSAWTAD
jgi:hypothetical protein